jgi:hypothetical protein
MNARRSNNKNEPRLTKVGKAAEQYIITTLRFLDHERVMIACLISMGAILLEHFSSVQLPFTYHTCYICLMLFLGFLMHLELDKKRNMMALEAKGVLAPIVLSPITDG